MYSVNDTFDLENISRTETKCYTKSINFILIDEI